MFYVALAALGHFANLALLKGTTGAVLQYVFALTGFALTIGDCRIGCLRGTAGSNRYGANPLAR